MNVAQVLETPNCHRKAIVGHRAGVPPLKGLGDLEESLPSVTPPQFAIPTLCFARDGEPRESRTPLHAGLTTVPPSQHADRKTSDRRKRGCGLERWRGWASTVPVRNKESQVSAERHGANLGHQAVLAFP